MSESQLPESVKQTFLDRWGDYRTEKCFLRKVRTLDPPPLLFHYTNAEGLKGIVEGHSMWFTDARYLNDFTEISHGVAALDLALTRMNRERKSLGFSIAPETVGRLTNAYVACFCEKGDLLTQWRGYSNAGGGYSLGFQGAGLFEVAQGRQLIWGPVQYNLEEAVQELTDEVQACRQALEEAQQSVGSDDALRSELLTFAEFRMLGVLTLIIPFLKHEAYSGEREWRLVEHRHPAYTPRKMCSFGSPGTY